MVKKQSLIFAALFTFCLTVLAGCESEKAPALNAEQKPATEVTKEKNKSYYDLLDFEDHAEYENATRGRLAAPERLEIKNESGKIVWSQEAYAFLEQDTAPDTVNPSLWKNAQLNHIYGLFEVTDGIYQVRGYDMTNITFIRGETGWIVFDPLMSVECSRAALQLLFDEVQELPITGIVCSHPHIDHYGGIKGIVSEEYVKEKEIPIIVPEGFEQHAVSENIYAGAAMSRRADYQYGNYLERSELGEVGIGIGQGQSWGSISYIRPTVNITETGETMVVDGVTMEFQLTPGTEAPAEMNIWFPEKKALWMAENCTGTLHNLYTLRGAQVRDGNAWAKYIMEAVERYGAEAEVVFQSHNWPHFGREQIREYLYHTASIYKYIHDQTLLYINQGYTENEIAAMISLPQELERVWYTRQYYGTLIHNAKAVYQKYMGWYDANPVNLNALPKTESAEKMVEYMGGDVEKILEKAKEDFAEGEYQWVAEITNLLVYQDPENKDARYLCADALEQLAYSAESGTWRNVYLTGALELRNGRIYDVSRKSSSNKDQPRAMTAEMQLDYLGIYLDSKKVEDLNCRINLNYTDDEDYLLSIRSGVVLYEKGVQSEEADATLTLSREGMYGLLMKNEDVIKNDINVEGDQDIIRRIVDNIYTAVPDFNIIEP